MNSKIKRLRCPYCFNHEVKAVDGYDDLYICDECAAELRGIEQYDGSIKLTDYVLDEGYNSLDDLEKPNASQDESKEYRTAFKLYVYDSDGNVVSDGFSYVSDALDFAYAHDYPVIKVHNYFLDEFGKIRPDGNPEVIWKDGLTVGTFIKNNDGTPCKEGCDVSGSRKFLKEDTTRVQYRIYSCENDDEELQCVETTADYDEAVKKANKLSSHAFMVQVVKHWFESSTNEYETEIVWSTEDDNHYPTYGNYHVELHAMYGSAEDLEHLIYDAFDTTVSIARINSDVVISSHDDEYDVVFELEILDQYVTLDEIREAVMYTLEDNDVLVTYWDIKEIPLKEEDKLT